MFILGCFISFPLNFEHDCLKQHSWQVTRLLITRAATARTASGGAARPPPPPSLRSPLPKEARDLLKR